MITITKERHGYLLTCEHCRDERPLVDVYSAILPDGQTIKCPECGVIQDFEGELPRP